MAATVKVRSFHGAGAGDGGTDCDGTTLRFKVADNDTQNTSNQMVRPGGGTTYSYIKQLRMRVTVAPVVSVTNLKFYMTGTAPTGTGVQAKTSATYVDATVQVGTQLTGTTNAYSYTATAPLSLAGSFLTGTDAAPLSFGDFVLLQFGVTSTASLGAPVSMGNALMRWDEQ